MTDVKEQIRKLCNRKHYSLDYMLYWQQHLYCKVCIGMGVLRPTDPPHHIKTRGSGGKDKDNLISLCWEHHRQVEQIGVKKFIQEYPWVRGDFKHALPYRDI